MTSARLQKVLVALLALLSLCTTLLIVLALARSRAASAAQAPQAPPPAPAAVANPPSDVDYSAYPATAPADQTAASLHGGFDDEQPAGPPPVLYDVPSFQLIESSGKPLGLKDLHGKAWIADFVFTQCGSICPRMTAQLSVLQRQLRQRPDWNDIRLVSFSVDPDHDTPAVLREYGKGFDAQPGHWLFLTGKRQQIWPLVREGFKLPVENAGGTGTSPILHSGKFVLVDRLGRIRGYYTGLESEGRAKLLAALNQVLQEKD